MTERPEEVGEFTAELYLFEDAIEACGAMDDYIERAVVGSGGYDGEWDSVAIGFELNDNELPRLSLSGDVPVFDRDACRFLRIAEYFCNLIHRKYYLYSIGSAP